MPADIFDQVADAPAGGDIFDAVSSEDEVRKQKAIERTAEAEKLLTRFRPQFTMWDDPMASMATLAGHDLSRRALLSGGKKTDVAIGVLAPLAGAVGGGLTAGPVGAAGGGATASGAADALVQAREYLRGEIDEPSEGRFLASMGLGAVVPPGVKAAATPLLTAGKTLLVRGGQGAGLGAAHEGIAQAIDQKGFHPDRIVTTALLGTLFGAGFGVLEGAAPHVLKALRGKTVAEARAIIAEELPKIDADAGMDVARKAEVRGVLEGAQSRIDEALGIKPKTGAAPTAGDTAIGRQAAAETAFGGEAPLTQIQKRDERAAQFRQGRSEDVRAGLLARQVGEGENVVLASDEVQNRLTALETQRGEARRERARLLAQLPEKPVVSDEAVSPNVELPPQASRLLVAEGYDVPPPVVRPRAPAVSQNRPKVDNGLADVLEQIGGNEPVGAPRALGLEGQPIEDAGTLLATKPEADPARGFPPRPELPAKERPGSNIFTEFYDAVKSWEKKVGEWVGNLSEKKPFIWQESPRTMTSAGVTTTGRIRALTRNTGNPDKPWRVTTFVPNREGDAFMPWGHQEYKTRAEAMIEDGKHIAQVHDRMPVRVMTEQEIGGFSHMDEVDPKSLHWYSTSDPKVVERLRDSQRTQGLVIDSFADGRVAFTEPVDPSVAKAFGLEAEKPPAVVAPEPKTKSKRIGLPADVEQDILNHIQELGGIKHPSKLNEAPGGEYDKFKDMWDVGGLPRSLVRRDGGGSTPDQLVGELADRGINLSDPDHFFAEIEKARAGRGGKRESVRTDRIVQRWEDAFLGDNAKLESGGKVITVDDLRVGQTFTVNKEKFTVTAIDENGFVTVKDGITRTLEPGTRIFPDKGKIKGGGKKMPDFLSPEDDAAAASALLSEKPAPAIAEPAEAFIPPTVRRNVSFAIKMLRENADTLERTQKDGPIGREQAWQKAQESITTNRAVVAEFRARAKEKGIDADAFIAAEGGEPDFGKFSKQAEKFAAEEPKVAPLSLESATLEQQAGEAATARERLLAQKQRDEIAARAEKPLVGDSSDVGQGTLLASDEDMFSGPSAERLLGERKPMADRGGLAGFDLTSESGRIDPRLLFSTPLQSAIGGIGGAAYGATHGATPEERRQNMLLYGAGGATLGAGSRIAGKAILSRASRKAVYEIDRHLMPPSGKPIGEKLAEAPNKAKAAFLTVFAPLDKLDADVAKANAGVVSVLPRSIPLSREFEQVAGATGKAGQDVKDYVRNVLDAVGDKDRQNFDRIVALKRIEQRLAWNDAHASDRKVVGDWDHGKVAADLLALESNLGPTRVAELDAIASGIMQKEADDALRLQVTSGRLSEEGYAAIKADNDFYAPFKVLDHIEGWDTGAGRAIDTRDSLAKTITGLHNEDFHIENPSVALAQHIFKGRVLAEKNLKMLELAKVADADVGGTLIRKLGPHDEPRRGYDTVNYFADGKPLRLEVKPEIANAVKGLNATETGMVANFARRFSTLFRFGATTANVGFQPVNFSLADQPNLWLVSKYGLKGANDVYRAPLDFAHGMYASVFSNLLGGEGGTFAKIGAKVPGLKQANDAAANLARQFYESGATGSNWQELIDTMGGTVDEKRLLGSLKLGEYSLLDSIGSVNKAIEESSKMMGFKRGLRVEDVDNLTPAQAEQALKKIVTEVRNFAGSPDFMRSGYVTRDLNNLVQMFLNARVQGITNLTGRLAGADGVGAARDAWLRIGGTIGTGAAYLWYQNHRPENEADYNSRSETERKNYFLFPRSDESGQPLYSTNEFGQNVREYWRLPKREVLQYMGNTVESALDFAHDKDPDAVAKYGEQMVENLSPVNISGRNARERFESAIGGANPLVKVPYEQISGRDTFRHRDILPTDDFKKASPGNQFTETTPKLLVQAARAMPDFAPDNLRSPMMLQNLVEGTSGRLLTQFLPKKQPEGRDPTAAAVAGNPLLSRTAGSLYVDRSREQADIDAIKQGEADVRIEKRRTARETMNELKGMTTDQATARLTELAANDPTLLDAVLTEAGKSERDVIDRQLLSLGVKNGARAQYIVGRLRKMNPEQATEYLTRLTKGDGAPLTDEVFQQIVSIMGNQ